MLRPQSAILLISLLLGIILPGCGGRESSVRYDGRLAAVDSLLRDEPDSALAIITALPTDCLATEHDRAYRDLLLTQARYRAYVTATSDSDINRAVAYFADCRPLDREKLTRAYIYKGAVMDELGHPDSAMLYYKHAEATAAPDDYFNLGYVKMRIATLYQDQFSLDTTAIIYKRQAISYFERLNDTNYLIPCYGDLGGLYGINHSDSAEFYLKQAIDLAQKINSPKQYTYKTVLAGVQFYQKEYRQSKLLAIEVLQNGAEYSKDKQFYFYAALSYLRLDHLDSAKYILESMPIPRDAIDSMNFYQVKAEIAASENNPIAYADNMSKSRDMQVKILNKKQDDKLKIAEIDFVRAQAENSELEMSHSNHHLFIALSIALILLILLIILAIRLRGIINKNLEDRKAVEQSLITTINELEDKLHHSFEKQESVSQLVGYRVEALNELFDTIKFKTNDVNSHDSVRSIIPLSSVIMGLSNTYHLLNIQLSDSFWEKLKLSVDGEYKGVATFIEREYPNLTLKEKRLFNLLCANVSPQIIKLCMNYTNVKSVSNRINFIIKKKMGLTMSLEEFLEDYMKNQENTL